MNQKNSKSGNSTSCGVLWSDIALDIQQRNKEAEKSTFCVIYIYKNPKYVDHWTNPQKCEIDRMESFKIFSDVCIKRFKSHS